MRKVNLLSVVVPCYQEEEILPLTHARLTAVLKGFQEKKICSHYELIYVDDGSQDNTLGILKGLIEKDPCMRIVALRCNFGHQAAICAGLRYARGDAVVTIDADLQDPPEKIEEMINFYEEDYDLVLGVRQDRSIDSFMKKVTAEAYYHLLKFMGVNIVHNHGDFRLMARPLVNEFNCLSERNRFIRAMILQLESRYGIVTYTREPRRKGKTKFTFRKMWHFSWDGIVSFSYVPLRLALVLGALMFVGSVIGIIWVFYSKITQRVVHGWASTILPIFAFGGFQLLVMGLIGEYIGRLYLEVKRRPLYVVRKEYRHESLLEETDQTTDPSGFGPFDGPAKADPLRGGPSMGKE